VVDFLVGFLDRIAEFFRINKIGVNHDNPEESCNPAKNNGSFFNSPRRTRRARRYKKIILLKRLRVHRILRGEFIGSFLLTTDYTDEHR
jgi:hypothetical protein